MFDVERDSSFYGGLDECKGDIIMLLVCVEITTARYVNTTI